MKVSAARLGAIALMWSAAVAAAGPALADEPVCPPGMYWNVDVAQCLWINPPNPVVGPVGPVGVGGVVGPVGVGPVGPGPVGPGPVGPGPVGPGR